MISIITVSYNSYDFLDLLIESLARYSHLPYELIVIDNSDNHKVVSVPHVHQFNMPKNIGHGRGLNHGVAKAYQLFPSFPFLAFFDVDCHILTHRWEVPFLKRMDKFSLVGAKGVPAKPIRPACIFMKKSIGKYDWCDTLNYQGHRVTPSGFDVGIKAYYQIMADGHNVEFMGSKPNRYGTLNGEEWTLDDVPVVYHHWHGSHLKERKVDFPNDDLEADKLKLFSKISWRII